MTIRRFLASAAMVGATLGVTTPVSAQTMPPDEYMELSRTIFSELIEINTTRLRAWQQHARRSGARTLPARCGLPGRGRARAGAR